MRRTASGLIGVAALVAGSTTSFAKAPKAGDVPTVEDIYQQAQKAIDDAAKAAAEKARDPFREAIESYRDRKALLTEFQKVVDIVNNAKDDNVQTYRADAAQAIVLRFTREDESDPQNRAIRRQIALALVDLMKADKKDEIGLRSIESILYAWWRMKMQMEFKFKATDKLEDRKKAYVKVKKFLEKGD